MQLNLELKESSDAGAKERVKKAKKKKQVVKYEPTWSEVWTTGYTSHTGVFKPSIKSKIKTEAERKKLVAVYKAIEAGELTKGVESLTKFSKAHAIRLYKILEEKRREAYIKHLLETRPTNYHTIQCRIDLDLLLTNLRKESYIALDTETTGVQVFFDDYMVGLSMSLPKSDLHYYIPIRHNTTEKQLEAEIVISELKPFIEDEALGKILHNARFDAHVLYKEGVELKGIIMDTQVSMHVLNENELNYKLKGIATRYAKYIGFEGESLAYDEIFGKNGFADVAIDLGTIYACKDTHLTLAVYDWIMSHLQKSEGLMECHLVETEIIKVVIDMERKGMRLDTELAEQRLSALEAQVNKLEERVSEVFGDTNLNSPQQLAELFYDKWKLKSPKKGKRPTDKKAVEALSKQNEDIMSLLEYRQVYKLLNTYVKPIPLAMASDGRIHGNFNQTGTVTGRFSSDKPNMQNIDPLSRNMFIPAEGHIIVGIDFSQQEPRLLAHFSQDEELINTYREGKDLYSKMASIIFKKPYEECGDKSIERKKTKTLVLAILYGMSEFSVAESLNITEDEAKQLRADFLDGLPSVKNWIQATYDFLEEHNYVEMLGGRKRRFPAVTKPLNSWDENAPLHHFPSARDLMRKFRIIEEEYGAISKSNDIYKLPIAYNQKKILRAEYDHLQGMLRKAVNSRIQGSAGYWTKRALIEARKYLKELGYGHIIGTIHDENLYELPNWVPLEVIETIEDKMMTAIELSVPAKVDTEIMPQCWGKGMSKEEWYKCKTI